MYVCVYVCKYVHLTFMLLLIYKPSQLYNTFEVDGIYITFMYM